MMLNATTQFANCVGLKGDSDRFVNPNVSSEEVLTIRNQQNNDMNARIATNALMT